MINTQINNFGLTSYIHIYTYIYIYIYMYIRIYLCISTNLTCENPTKKSRK